MTATRNPPTSRPHDAAVVELLKAQRAGIPRETLYRALGPKGNPTVKTLLAVLGAAGLRVAVTRDSAHA